MTAVAPTQVLDATRVEENHHERVPARSAPSRRLGAIRSAINLSLGFPVGLLLWALIPLALLATIPLLGSSRYRAAPINLLLRPMQRFEAFRYDTFLRMDDLSPARTPWRGLRDPAVWRFLTYGILRAPVGLAQNVILLVLVVMPVYAIGVLLEQRFGLVTVFYISGYGYPSLPDWSGVLALTWPWSLPMLARADHWLTRTLLGADVSEMEQQIGHLVDARQRTVDEAERERERIERDLHDGAQQRLIALSILLGRTEQRLSRGEPDEALADVRRAKGETLAVIAEIRGLTQGLRPAVLESRGLDAALSSVAARLELPVTIDVQLPQRPAPPVEAALYFAISELLTNTVKHAGARSARVDVSQADGQIVALVTDDGCGGADPARGSGLRGIADRLAGVDGTLHVSSPFGGPTIVSLEVPCGS